MPCMLDPQDKRSKHSILTVLYLCFHSQLHLKILYLFCTGTVKIAFLPVLERGRLSIPQVPIVRGAKEIRPGRWTYYNPAESPPSLDLTEDEYRQLHEFVRDAASAAEK